MKNLNKQFLALFAALVLFSNLAIAQTPERNIGLTVVLKPKLGMAYEYDQALREYTTTFRKDSAYAVRVTRVTGGPRNGSDVISEPLKTWTELDATRPYISDASARAWQNVLKYCESAQSDFYYYDRKNSNALPKYSPSNKYVSYVWVVDPKANEDVLAAEFKKAAQVLKQAGYHFAITHTLSGNVRYQIQLQLENGFKDMDIKMPSYKEVFTKAFSAAAYEKHNAVLQACSSDFFVEFRSVRTSMSTR